MGEAMRRFWIPACLSEELPEAGGDPLHIELLGENFVAFRSEDGSVGLLDEHCCHRGVSLTVGRVEGCGIRCIYHGWLFAADGAVLETPNVPDPRFKDRIKARGYPVIEAGSIIWAYLGPTEKMPPLPDFPWNQAAPSMVLGAVQIIGCNYVQLLEGLIDSSHLTLLHSSALQQLAGSELNFARATSHMKFEAAPRIDGEETEFGLHYAAIRNVDGVAETRVTAFVAPFWQLNPNGDVMVGVVPMSDTKTAFYTIFHDGTREFANEPLRTDQLTAIGATPERLEEFGQTRTGFYTDRRMSRANGFRQDRDMMRKGHFTGMPTLVLEDALMCVSAGELRSRKVEYLTTSDLAIALFYRVLLRSVRQVQDGGDPIGYGVSLANVAGIHASLSPDVAWRTLVPHHRKPGEQMVAAE